MFNDKKARKKFSKFATDSNYKYAIIIGVNEMKHNSVAIKNLNTRIQENVSIDDIRDYISL